MYNGYDFYIEGIKLPFAPPSMKITANGKNEVIDLLNGGEVNILHSRALTEVEFTARFPMRKYPYAPNPLPFDAYWSIFRLLRDNKAPCIFVVTRSTPNGVLTWDTCLLMAIEDLVIDEDWENGDDVLVDFKLKQYKVYGTKTANVTTGEDGTPQISQSSSATSNSDTSSGAFEDRVTKQITQTNYKIKSGDTLYDIAKQHFGDGNRWTEIYEANKTVIENAAKSHGKSSSSNGHWIWSGTELVLPAG